MEEQIESGATLPKEDAVQIILQAALQYAVFLEDDGNADEHDRKIADMIYAAFQAINVIINDE